MLLLVFPRSIFGLLRCFSNFSPYASTRPAVRFCSALAFAPVKFFLNACVLLFSVNFVLRALPRKLRVCAMRFPSVPVKFLHGCVLFYSVDFVLRALPRKHRVCAVLFPRFLEIFCTLVFCFIIQSIIIIIIIIIIIEIYRAQIPYK